MKTTHRIGMFVFLIFYFILVQALVSDAKDLGYYKDLRIRTLSPNICRTPLNVYIEADDHSYFTGNKIDVQNAVGIARMALMDCPDIKQININGMVNRKIAYRGHITEKNGWRLTDDFYKDITAPAPWGAYSDSRSWTTSLIGTWKGYKIDTELEIALWVPGRANAASPFLYAFVRTTDGMCSYKSDYGLMGNWDAYHLPKESTAAYEVLHLQYSILPDLIAVNGSSGISRESERLCDEGFKGFNFTVYVEKKTGQAYMYNGKSSLYLHPQAPLWPLERVDASKEMMTLIEKGGISGPSPAQKILIADKTKRFETYKNQIPISCMVDHQFALFKLREAGINKIEAFKIDGEKMVEVNSRNLMGQKSSAFYPANLDIDWNHLSLGKSFKFSEESACEHAAATLAFLSQAHGKQFNKNQDQYKVAEKFNTLDGYYLIDAHGVDIIKGYSARTGGIAERSYGSTTVFWPGDKTREVRWDDLSQKIIIQNYIKSVIDQKIVRDIFNDVDERKFVQDKKLSVNYKSIVFSSIKSKYQENVCYEWNGKIHVDTCAKYRQKESVKEKLYLTKDKNIAIALFKSLSPVKETWIGLLDDQDKCPGGPFCDLEAGQYLNTIYRGDFKKLREIEDKALRGSNNKIKELMFNDEKMFKFLTLISGGGNLTLLPYAVNEYMYAYQKIPRECFKPGAVVTEYRDRTPDIVYKDVYMDGSEVEVFRTQGYDRYAKYVINKEFIPACNELCRVRDSQVTQQYFDSWLNKENALYRKIYNGLNELLTRYGCNSPEVKQFEENLLRLYFYNKSQLRTQSFHRNTF